METRSRSVSSDGCCQKLEHIYGIEIEEKAYGLATTNMLIHGDGNSNIKFGSCFDCKDFIKQADPDIILMNPPYNEADWYSCNDIRQTGENRKMESEDPTKGTCIYPLSF